MYKNKICSQNAKTTEQKRNTHFSKHCTLPGFLFKVNPARADSSCGNVGG